MFDTNRIYQGDCLLLMSEIEDESIDMILCDLPYGITQCKWDSVIPLEQLWSHYLRVIKKNGAIVLTASQPFTSALVMSNPKMFKYDWVWQKTKGTGHLNAKKQPMRDKEDVLVFSRNTCRYNPQLSVGTPFKNKRGNNADTYGQHGKLNYQNDGFRYPKQVLRFSEVGRGSIHPTQKPVALFEYLIRTYTLEGEIVLDNCSGSGTTAIACLNTRRRFICIEKELKYVEVSRARVNKHRAKLLRERYGEDVS